MKKSKNKVKLTLHKVICVCLCITEIKYYQHRIFIKIITAYNVNIVHTYIHISMPVCVHMLFINIIGIIFYICRQKLLVLLNTLMTKQTFVQEFFADQITYRIFMRLIFNAEV